jgi:hypothetical protein
MFFSKVETKAKPASTMPLIVRHALAGRGHSGKSAMLRFARRRMLQRNLPSGLEFDVDDPRKNTELVRDFRTTRKLLEARGLLPTETADQLTIELYEGEHKRAVLQSREAVGQVYTETTSSSPADMQDKYRDHVTYLSQASVIWGVLPVPREGSTSKDLARYEDDLLNVRTLLRDSLRKRPENARCAVALVITKLDTLFESEEEARRQLTDEELHRAVHPIANMLKSSDKVSYAIINPVSAFGFGNAVPLEQESEDGDGELRASAAVAAAGEDEIEWILRPDAAVEPFNVVPLIVWSLLAGMLNHEVETGDGHDLTRICRMLRDDLDSLGGWQVPIKGSFK